MTSARATLDLHVHNVGERFRAEIDETMTLLRDRQRELAGVYKGLLEERCDQTSGYHLQDHQCRLDACQKRSADLEALRLRMDAILISLRGGRRLV
jgi:hypothetical protein